MKQLIIFVIALFFYLSISAGEFTEVSLDKNYKEKGFLKYKGVHNNHTVIALSDDIGSGVPSEDLRIYISINKNYYKRILHIPLLSYKGFKCIAKEDIIEIYLTETYDHDVRNIDKASKVFLTLDISELIKRNKKLKTLKPLKLNK
jgi:hypothetical protein